MTEASPPLRRADAGAASQPLLRRILKLVLRAYMRGWHRLQFVGEGIEHLPPTGPALVLVNHVSALDVPALIAVDPYPNTGVVAKDSLFKIAPLRPFLRAYSAIPVSRDRRDTAAIRQLLSALQDGGVIAIAAEGTRSRDGRLLPINPVLARIAVRAGVPLIPVGISGSFEALPPGAIIPRPRQVTVRVGMPFRLPKDTPAEVAAERIRAEIAALLPPESRP